MRWFLSGTKSICYDTGKIIAERNDFQQGPMKRSDLEDVVFSGGLHIYEDHIVLYAGISDAGAQKIKLENPFR